MSQDQKISDGNQFKFINGRRYHNIPTSNYPLPIDEIEFKRSRIQHKVMKGVWGNNFASPIEKGLTNGKGFKVLDVGCGSGTWILQLSKEYPLTNFIGLDMSPTFPKVFSQNNLQFIQGDVLKGLPFENDTFDFVHMRLLVVAFTQKQWKEIVVKELIRVCKPGGWVELEEVDIEGKSMGPTSKRLLTFWLNYLESKEINGLISEELPEFLEATNQVGTIYADEICGAIGNWGGGLGKLAAESFTSIFRGLKEFSKWIGISEEEHEIMINQFVKETNLYRSRFTSFRFYCQKNM